MADVSKKPKTYGYNPVQMGKRLSMDELHDLADWVNQNPANRMHDDYGNSVLTPSAARAMHFIEMAIAFKRCHCLPWNRYF